MLPEPLTDPRALAALGLVIAGLIQYQRTLSWSEYRTIHALKRGVLPLVDRYTGLFVVSDKGGMEDEEFVSHLWDTPKSVFKSLVNDGASPHLVNSIKRRTHPTGDGYQYSVAHLVYFHDDGTQTEIYLFRSGEGGTHVYAHHETGVQDPEGHMNNTNQQDGDVRDVLPKWVA